MSTTILIGLVVLLIVFSGIIAALFILFTRVMKLEESMEQIEYDEPNAPASAPPQRDRRFDIL